jgi:hypothetical protein
MEPTKIQALFKQFLSEFDSARKIEIWESQRQIFKRFWSDKILNPKSELTVDDTDAIIRLLDTKARGHQKTDEPVATTGIRQGLWERLFDTLKSRQDIQRTLDQIFAEAIDAKLIGLINRLEQENKSNKNGLTGKSAVMLNALLFINNPTNFVSIVSLSHRFQIMRAFDLGNPDEFKTYGEQIVLSNRKIIDGFRDKYGVEANPRDLSAFMYTPHGGHIINVMTYWQRDEPVNAETAEVEIAEASQDGSEVEFAMENHLEDFLVKNWEHTELGKKYELIVEDGDLVSQQYRTDVGNIDLLVRDKGTKQYVVIELKKGQTSDATVGQIARYMGWVRKNRANSHEVKGIIIARSNDLRLQYALQEVRNVELLVYKVNFVLERPTSF